MELPTTIRRRRTSFPQVPKGIPSTSPAGLPKELSQTTPSPSEKTPSLSQSPAQAGLRKISIPFTEPPGRTPSLSQRAAQAGPRKVSVPFTEPPGRTPSLSQSAAQAGRSEDLRPLPRSRRKNSVPFPKGRPGGAFGRSPAPFEGCLGILRPLPTVVPFRAVADFGALLCTWSRF